MCVDIDRARLTELFPGGDEIAVLVEDLDAIILTIGDVHIPLGTADVDVVGFPEVAGFRPHVPPLLDELAVRRILHDAGAVQRVTGMAIRHKNIAIGRNGNSGRPVKRIGPVPGHAFTADRHQHFARRTYLEDLLAHRDALRVLGGHVEDRLGIICIGRPYIPVFIDGESVRMRE